MRFMCTTGCAALLIFTSAGSAGVGVPTVEDFDSGPANWADAFNNLVTWEANGGPTGDGDGFVHSGFNFANNLEGDRVSLFRGHDDFDSSNDAFVGNWLASGVSEFSFWVRHDHVAPLNFFTRFSTPDNFPGTIGLTVVPVLPNTWTKLTIDLDPNNPLIIPEGGPGTYEATFSNIGNLQIGLEVGAGLAGLDSTITFDLDGVSAIPTPGVLPALMAAGVFSRRRRRS